MSLLKAINLKTHLIFLAYFLIRSTGRHVNCDVVTRPFCDKILFYDVLLLCIKMQNIFLLLSGDENPLSLSSHPNIIPVRHVFTDDMPCLYDSKVSYPAALPLRHDGNGLGRNRTLCLVMPKYDCTLGEYLSEYRGQLSIKESVMLFAQLLEGITHLVAHSVAHRDLKTDNILLNTHATGCPKLVITDFGCCLAEREWGLQLPFQTNYVNRGGNSALMAPEV